MGPNEARFLLVGCGRAGGGRASGLERVRQARVAGLDGHFSDDSVEPSSDQIPTEATAANCVLCCV